MSVRILFTSGQCLGQQRSEAQQSRPRKRERKFRVFLYIQQRIANGRMKAFQECVPYQNETFSFFPKLLLAISLCVAVIHCCYAKNLMTLLVNCLCRMMFDRHVPSIELVLPEYIYRVSSLHCSWMKKYEKNVALITTNDLCAFSYLYICIQNYNRLKSHKQTGPRLTEQ